MLIAILKICDVRFTQSGILNGHISAVHEVNKPFKCNICDASFSQKGSLNGHIPSVQEGNWLWVPVWG